MKKVCVLIRVYDRVVDLKYCVQLIRDTWKHFNYFIIVVSNGKSNGFIVEDDIKSLIDCYVELPENAGHLKGNSQLLLQGIRFIPDDCAYTIILEADTWVYGDNLILKYTNLLEMQDSVWASARWYNYLFSLATDFAILKSDFIKENIGVFRFTSFPEYYVAYYLRDNGFTHIYIRENTPINLPVYIKRYPFAPKGRFIAFPRSQAVSHHIEDFKGGIDEKKLHFNVVAKVKYFNVDSTCPLEWIRIKIKLAMLLSYLLPHRSWFVRRKDIDFSQSNT